MMLLQHRDEIIKFASGAMENLTFAIKCVFLQIQSYRLGGAEILQCVRHLIAHFFAQAEEMIHSAFRCKDNGSVVWQGYFLLTELLGGKALYSDKWTEIKFYLIFFFNVIVGRFVRLRFGL